MNHEPLTIRLKHGRDDAPEETYSTSEPPRKKHKSRTLKRAVIAVVAVAVLAVGGWFAFARLNTAGTTPKDTQDVVDKVGKLMVLPDETPTIAVVSDVTKLQGQAFFANAHQGDIVLMYANARKAILYSPSLNKIVEDAPITNGEVQTQ